MITSLLIAHLLSFSPLLQDEVQDGGTVGGFDVVLRVTEVFEKTTEKVALVLEQAHITEAQKSLDALTKDKNATNQQIFYAVKNLHAAYQRYLKSYGSLQNDIGAAISEIEQIQDKVTDKLAAALSPQSHGSYAKSARYDETLDEIASEIARKESIGEATDDLKREFAIRLQGFQILQAIEKGRPGPEDLDLIPGFNAIQDSLQVYQDSLITTSEVAALTHTVLAEESVLLEFALDFLQIAMAQETLQGDLKKSGILASPNHLKKFAEGMRGGLKGSQNSSISRVFKRVGVNLSSEVELPSTDTKAIEDEIARRVLEAKKKLPATQPTNRRTEK